MQVKVVVEKLCSDPETVAGAVSADPHPTTASEAFALGLDCYYPQWPPLPPVRVNGQWVPWQDVSGPVKIELSDTALGFMLVSSVAPHTTASAVNESGIRPLYSGPSSQSALAPTRPPTSPVKGKGGDYSLFYYSYPTTNTWAVPESGSEQSFFIVLLTVALALKEPGQVCGRTHALGRDPAQDWQ
jgi:hypothetical protein